MAEIVNTSKSKSSESETLSDSDEEIDLEEKLLKSLQELKRLKKIILNHENKNKRLQEELEEVNQIIENHKILVVEKDKKLNAYLKSFLNRKLNSSLMVTTLTVMFLGIK